MIVIETIRELKHETFFDSSEEMNEYINKNGWHFSEKMCAWAVEQMKTKDGKLNAIDKEEIDKYLNDFGIKIDTSNYDYVYIINMAAADYYKSSLENKDALYKFLVDVMNDADSYEGMVFMRFCADCFGKKITIP